MKNIFKSLMLVAVAAMAFTACQNEPEYVAENGGETIEIRVEAGVDDTRVYFGDKVLNYYAAYWHGTETVNGFLCEGKDGSGAEHYDAVELTSEIAGDNRVFFDLKFTDVKDVKDGVVKLNVGYNKSFTVPTAQTPLADSVDPAAMFLSGEASFSNGAYENLLLDLGFDTAYGKMTLKGLKGDVVSVEVLVDGTDNYKLLADNVENNEFWFACAEAAAPKTLAVTVEYKDNELKYRRDIDLSNASLENPFKFEKGTVSVFSVDMSSAKVISKVDSAKIKAGVVKYAGESQAYYSNNIVAYQFSIDGNVNNPYVNIIVNRDDAPGANSLKPGKYTFVKPQIDAENKYAVIEEGTVFIKRVKESAENNAVSVESGLMEVVYDPAAGEYHIYIEANGTSFGYKGMPETVGSMPTWIAYDDFEPVTLAVPAGLEATTIEYDNITLKWNSVEGADYYEVYLGNPAGASNATGIRVDGTSYTYTGYVVGDEDKAGITQQWAVRAVSNYPAERQTSAWSTLASFVYPEKPVQLDAPNVSVKAGSDAEYGSVTIQWNAVNNADYYAVYNSAADNATPVATITTTEYTYTYTDLNAGTAYLWVRAMSNGSAINSELAQVSFTVPEKSQGGEVTIPEGYAKLDSIALGSASYNEAAGGYAAAFSYVNANSEREYGSLIYWPGGASATLKEGTYTWAQYPDYSGTGLAFKIHSFRHNGLKPATSGEMKVEGKLLTFSFTAEGTEYKYYHIME